MGQTGLLAGHKFEEAALMGLADFQFSLHKDFET